MRFLSIIRYTILLVEEVQSVNLVQYIVWLLIIKEFFFFFLTKKNLLVMSPKCMIETHCFDLCECILNLTTLWSQAISSLCYYLTFFFNKWIYIGIICLRRLLSQDTLKMKWGSGLMGSPCQTCFQKFCAIPCWRNSRVRVLFHSYLGCLKLKHLHSCCQNLFVIVLFLFIVWLLFVLDSRLTL